MIRHGHRFVERREISNFKGRTSALGGTRTPAVLIRNQVLFRLSYECRNEEALGPFPDPRASTSAETRWVRDRMDPDGRRWYRPSPCDGPRVAGYRRPLARGRRLGW